MNKSLFKFLIIILFLFLSLAHPVRIYPSISDIKFINQEDYFPVALKTIINAEHSIYVAMPYIQKVQDNGPVSKLLDALADARKKDVCDD